MTRWLSSVSMTLLYILMTKILIQIMSYIRELAKVFTIAFNYFMIKYKQCSYSPTFYFPVEPRFVLFEWMSNIILLLFHFILDTHNYSKTKFPLFNCKAISLIVRTVSTKQASRYSNKMNKV